MNISRNLKLLRVLLQMRQLKPTFVSFNSLNACNSACPMCAVWRQDEEKLSVAEIVPIVKELKKTGFLVMEISGGEPFLREDIYDIFAALDDSGFLYTTATNGTLLTPEGIERLKKARGLLQLAVSMDSLDPSTYARLRGRDFLPVVLRNLELLLAADLPFPVKVNLVMNRLNYKETDNFLEFVTKKGICLSVFPVNQGVGFSHRHSDPQFTPTEDERQQMAEIFRNLADKRRSGEPLWEYSAFYELAAQYVLGKPVGPCDAGNLYIDLNADGQIAPCLDHEGVGDIRLTNMENLWTALRRCQPAISECSCKTPCCYTCTYNISLTARNSGAFMLETARMKLRQMLRGR